MPNEAETAPGGLPILIDRRVGTPASAQLVTELRKTIDGGHLLPHDRLPTVRAMAAHLGLAPNTVAKAYRALETAGYVEGRGRAGTFVSNAPPPVDEPAEALAEAAKRYVRRARHLGFGSEESLRAVRRTLS